MLGPFDKEINYLSSSHSDPTLYWKPFATCRLEAVNSTKCCRYPDWACWVWAEWKHRCLCGHLWSFASRRSSCNEDGVEWVLRLPINSVGTLNSQQSLRHVRVPIGDTAFSLEQLNNLRTVRRGHNILTKATCLYHAIDFQVILYCKRYSLRILFQGSFYV